MSSRSNVIVIGGVVGAVLGASAAWVFTQGKTGSESGITAGYQQMKVQAGAPELVKIAVALIGLVRQIVDLAKPA